MDQSDQKSKVPKFASFQAKKPEEVKQRAKRQKVDDEEGKESQKRDKIHRHYEHSTDIVKPKRHHDGSHSHHSQEKSKSAVISSLSSHVANSDLFAIDKRGDKDILTYGSLRRSEVPRYRRSGQGYIVGLDRAYRIDRSESDYKTTVVRQKSSFKTDGSKNYSTAVHKSPRTIKSDERKLNQAFDPSADYVELGRKKKSSNQNSQFRMNLGFEVDANPDSDLEDAVDSDSEPDYDDEMETEVRKSHSKLSALVNSDPQNLSYWLDLINHQDKVVALGKTSVNEEGKLGLSKLKISLYQRALNKIGRDKKAQETLQLGMLEEASRLGDSAKLQDLWKQTIQGSRWSIKLRLGYIDFLQRNATSFRFEKCKQEYLNFFQFLAHQLDSEKDLLRVNELINAQAYLLLRFGAFTRDSGYHELSLAIWQSALDLALSPRPENFDKSQAIELFEQFWESEVPRLGEEGYSSWISFDADAKHVLPLPIIMPKRRLKSGGRLWASFIEGELKTPEELKFPGRTIDEAGEDDAFHIVLFSDLQPVLESLSSPFKTPELLFAAFLCYVGLPHMESSLIDAAVQKWWQDPFVNTWPMNFNEFIDEKYSSSYELPSFWAFRRTTTDVLFGDGFKDLVVPDAIWTGRILKFFCEQFSEHEELAEYYIAYLLAASGSKTAAKSAKQLLKSRKSSARLYNAYACVEFAAGNLNVADNVFSAAISGLTKTFSERDRKDLILLHRTWIWQMIYSGRFQEAITMLYTLGKSDLPESPGKINRDSARFLAARQSYQDGLNQARLASDAEMIALHAELSAMLTYFHNDQSLDMAIQEYRRLEPQVTLDESFTSTYREMLHQYRTKLVTYHVKTVKLHKPSDIAILLKESIKAFPQNTDFIIAYVQHQRQFGVDDRLRSLFSNKSFLDMEDSLVYWYAIIWAESQRGPDFGGTIHGMRSVFNRAVESTIGKNSLSLWMTFLNFEILRGTYETVKGLVFRGMAHIPWSKWFIIAGMKHLIDLLPIENFGAKLFNIIELRELRIHGGDLSTNVDTISAQ